MTMKPCKAKLPDGKSCPNQADEGQEYCPYHLANQTSKVGKIFKTMAAILAAVFTSIFAIVKFLIRIKRI